MKQTSLHDRLHSEERRLALQVFGWPSRLQSWPNFEAQYFSSFPVVLWTPPSRPEKRETAFPSPGRGQRSFCFAHRAARFGPVLSASMAKEYVGYSGEKPSSPGHSSAAGAWEGKESVQATSATSAEPLSAARKSISMMCSAQIKSQRILLAYFFFRLSPPPTHPIPPAPVFSPPKPRDVWE